jgi:hypothetical protein
MIVIAEFFHVIDLRRRIRLEHVILYRTKKNEVSEHETSVDLQLIELFHVVAA